MLHRCVGSTFGLQEVPDRTLLCLGAGSPAPRAPSFAGSSRRQGRCVARIPAPTICSTPTPRTSRATTVIRLAPWEHTEHRLPRKKTDQNRLVAGVLSRIHNDVVGLFQGSHPGPVVNVQFLYCEAFCMLRLSSTCMFEEILYVCVRFVLFCSALLCLFKPSMIYQDCINNLTPH